MRRHDVCLITQLDPERRRGVTTRIPVTRQLRPLSSLAIALLLCLSVWTLIALAVYQIIEAVLR